MASKYPLSDYADGPNIVPKPRPNPRRVAKDKLRSQLMGRALQNYLESDVPNKRYENMKGQVIGPSGKGI